MHTDSRVRQPYLSGFRLAIKVAIIGASFSFIELEVAIRKKTEDVRNYFWHIICYNVMKRQLNVFLPP